MQINGRKVVTNVVVPLSDEKRLDGKTPATMIKVGSVSKIKLKTPPFEMVAEVLKVEYREDEVEIWFGEVLQ